MIYLPYRDLARLLWPVNRVAKERIGLRNHNLEEFLHARLSPTAENEKK